MKKMLMFKKKPLGPTSFEWHPDNPAAKMVCDLCGSNWLVNSQIELLKLLGFKVYVIK